MAKNYALSKCGGLLQFINPDIIAGITTVEMGDFTSSAPASKKNYQALALSIGAKRISSLAPRHNSTISLANNTVGLARFQNDALIHGNPDTGLLALIHCSRITLVDNIIKKVINRLTSWSGLGINKFKAIIYAGICPECYEVDSPIKNQFKEYSGFFQENGRSGHYQFDLGGLINYQLIRLGINKSNIEFIDICSRHYTTACLFDNSDEVWSRDNYLLFSRRDRSNNQYPWYKTGNNAVYAKLLNGDTVLAGSTGNCPYVLLYRQ